ncbi:MAG: exodeoxyribonuclease V subunit alpha [Steroidobacterales bacterium]
MSDAAQQLAQGFAYCVGLWARRLDCDAATLDALRTAAAHLSLATSDGHVCVSLAELPMQAPSDVASLRRRLLSSGLVGTPDAPGALPMILDGDERLYLHRYFDDERRLALRLRRAATQAGAPLGAATRERLDQLFAANAVRLAGGIDWQKIAAVLALRNRLTIISGGPGTGKTTTVVNLLACLLTQHPELRIALAAPTGKARARLLEAIQQHADRLPAGLRALLPRAAFTIHRLLGARPDNVFEHHAGNPLAIDALVVDEASMLDLALATRLFEAVPDHAHIILLGDKDQLAAVESGAVFAELCVDPHLSEAARREIGAICGVDPQRINPPPAQVSGFLPDAVVWFRDNFRFASGSGIGRLAADISAGRTDAVLEWLRRGAEPGVTWLEDGARTLGLPALASLSAGFEPYLAAVRGDVTDRAAIAAALGAFRVLCAVRDGARGVTALNERIGAHTRKSLRDLAQSYDCDPHSAWYPGRAVLVTRNDYVLNLMNGDVGITLPDQGHGLRVFFADGDGGFRAIAPARMPPHETAFATTVHKAQGSEFGAVMLVLPDKPGPVMTRELLYTAVTRARARVTLCAGDAVLRAAIDAPTRRYSGLLARLREVAAAAESSDSRTG